MLFKEPTPSASKNPTPTTSKNPTPTASKTPTPTTSKNENSQNNVEINDGSEVVTESNSSGCAPIQENLIEKVSETKDNKEATFKKKPVESNEEVVSNKNNADGDDKTNQTKQKVQAHEATGSSTQPKKRFSFKLGTIHILRKQNLIFTKTGFLRQKQWNFLFNIIF